MRHLRPHPLALALALTLACGGNDGPTGGTPGGNISLETSRAVSDSIGPAGGTLTAHATNGVTYALAIPAGALLAPQKITLTPIAAQKNVPVSGGFAAGVDLAPAGLHFARAAVLTVSPSSAPPAGMVAAAVTFEGDGDSLGVTPLLAGQGQLSALVTHFSGLSVVFGTTADLQSLAALVRSGVASQPFLNQLVLLGVPAPPGNPAALPILQQWFADVVLPQLQAAGTDAELLLAVGDYDQWGQMAELYLTGNVSLAGGLVPPSIPSGLASEAGQAATAAAASLRQAIAGNNSVCLTQHNLQALLNVIFWQGYARYFGVDTPAEQLDVPSLLPGLCAQFVAESIGLVDPIPLNQTVSFDQVWAVEIGSSPPLLPADFQVSITAGGPVTVSTPAGFTGPDPQGGPITRGFYTTVVAGQQAGTASFQVDACLISPFASLGQPAGSSFCGLTMVGRQVGSGAGVNGTWTGGAIYICANTITNAPLTFTVQGTTSAISGDWTIPGVNCAPGGIHGTFSATMDPVQGKLLSLSMDADSCTVSPAPLHVEASSGTFGPGNGVPFAISADTVSGGGWVCGGVFAVQATAVALQGPIP